MMRRFDDPSPVFKAVNGVAEKFDFKKAFFFVSPEAWEILADVQSGIEKRVNVIIDKRVPLLTAYVVSAEEMGNHMRMLPLTPFNIRSLVVLAETPALEPIHPR